MPEVNELGALNYRMRKKIPQITRNYNEFSVAKKTVPETIENDLKLPFGLEKR
jgi:hypothetical protein